MAQNDDPRSTPASTGPTNNGSGLASSLIGSRGRLGIVGIIIIVIAALWFGVSPQAALNLFNGGATSGAPANQTGASPATAPGTASGTAAAPVQPQGTPPAAQPNNNGQ
ncbi:MAG: hypothetical protein INR65_00665 [Gluconacetobacter diazotrophicus]|nr:hypothetical protein [Gluconacetobacter diazotrophicus]